MSHTFLDDEHGYRAGCAEQSVDPVRDVAGPPLEATPAGLNRSTNVYLTTRESQRFAVRRRTGIVASVGQPQEAINRVLSSLAGAASALPSACLAVLRVAVRLLVLGAEMTGVLKLEAIGMGNAEFYGHDIASSFRGRPHEQGPEPPRAAAPRRLPRRSRSNRRSATPRGITLRRAWHLGRARPSSMLHRRPAPQETRQ